MNHESEGIPPDAFKGDEGEAKPKLPGQASVDADKVDHLSRMIDEMEQRADALPDERLPRAGKDETNPRIFEEELKERKKFIVDLKTCSMLSREVIRLTRQLIELSKIVSFESQMEIIDSPHGKAIGHFQDANAELLDWMNGLAVDGSDDVESRQLVAVQLATLRSTETLLRMMIAKAEKHRGGSSTS